MHRRSRFLDGLPVLSRDHGRSVLLARTTIELDFVMLNALRGTNAAGAAIAQGVDISGMPFARLPSDDSDTIGTGPAHGPTAVGKVSREEVVRELQATLVDLDDLSANRGSAAQLRS